MLDQVYDVNVAQGDGMVSTIVKFYETATYMHASPQERNVFARLDFAAMHHTQVVLISNIRSSKAYTITGILATETCS